MSHVFALAGSLPDAAANIYISQETMIASVKIVHMNVVAASMMSCTNNQTDVGSHWSLTESLIHRVSYMLNLHWPFIRQSLFIVIPAGAFVCACVVAKNGSNQMINIIISQSFFIYRFI